MWIFLLIFGLILGILLNVILYAKYYFTSQLSLGGFAQVLYTMQSSMSGSESTWSEAVSGFFVRQWPWLVLLAILAAGFVWLYRTTRQGKEPVIRVFGRTLTVSLRGIRTAGTILLAFLLVTCLFQGHELYGMFGIDEYQANQGKESDLYDKYYADPRSVSVEFPKEKRNLVYILCESMEATYAGTDEGGGFKKSLIPELTELAKDNTDFSNDPDRLNGGLTPGNTGWTIAGIAAQSMGIPLNVGNGEFNRNFEDESQFLPYVVGLGDILKENGYHNYFMCGSESEFAGRRNFYEQHGDHTVYDYNTAKTDGVIPDDYRVWWGMEDDKLFTYAEKELTEVASKNQPFNFTMLTVDTHFTDGYKCKDCPDEFDNQYENVIRCSDHKVAEFVHWIQKQDFYKNTTIVIAGDHKSMDGMVAENIPEGYERKTFFTVINGPEYTLNTTREYSTLDIYPTIIEALGAKIDGDRLGLGTSLYSRKPTLIEELGFEELNREMSQKSTFYDEVILKGDESKLPKEEDPDSDSEEEDDSGQQELRTISAQEYVENRENFENPDYSWTPPAEEPVYDPGYVQPSVPEETEPAPSQPSDPGSQPSQTPTSPSTPPSGDNTGSDTGNSGNTGGNTGENTGTDPGQTPPSTGGNTGTETPDTPPAGGTDTGSQTQETAGQNTTGPAQAGSSEASV